MACGEELSQYSYLVFLKFDIMRQYRMLAQSSSRESLVGVETLLRWVRTSGLKIRGPRSTSTSIADSTTPLSITVLVPRPCDNVQLQR